MNFTYSDPEEIAQKVFSQPPQNKLLYQIIPSEVNNSSSDFYESYRILITILFEGLNILTDNCLDQAKSDNFTTEHILALNPWFHDMGIDITCELVDKTNNDSYDNYYCKCVINEQSYNFLFEKNQINKNYHFFVNAKFINEQPNVSNIEDIYSVFICGDKVMKIYFNLYTDIL